MGSVAGVLLSLGRPATWAPPDGLGFPGGHVGAPRDSPARLAPASHCRLVAMARAIAAIAFPDTSRWPTSAFWAAERAESRPRAFPSALARCSPACVCSMSKSRSNSATAAMTPMAYGPLASRAGQTPAAKGKAVPPDSKARQCLHRGPHVYRVAPKAVHLG